MRCTKEWILKSESNNQKSLVDRLLEVRGIKSEDAKRELMKKKKYSFMAILTLMALLQHHCY